METPPFPSRQMFVLGECDTFKTCHIRSSAGLQSRRPWRSDEHGEMSMAFADDLRPALCRICEPIAFMSIFPYVYYMVRSFDITTNSKQLAMYVGLVTSAFAFAEFSSGVVWGRISDRVGRKPVLVCGLAGTALSMVLFGFATNLPMALLARALGGLLNGYRSCSHWDD